MGKTAYPCRAAVIHEVDEGAESIGTQASGKQSIIDDIEESGSQDAIQQLVWSCMCCHLDACPYHDHWHQQLQALPP